MSDGTNILGADLEALLREAAADPRSQLLRVPRPKSVQGLLERQAVLRPSATELSVLDRHLLAAHRAEIAELLLRACRIVALEDPGVVARAYDSMRSTGSSALEFRQDWAATAQAIPWDSQPEQIDAEVVSLLDAFTASDLHKSIPSVTQLALAANRLQPSSRAVAWTGFDLATHDQSEAAIRILEGLLESCPRLDVASVSLENLGMAFSDQGRLEDAARTYRAAFERDHGRSTALVGWLHYSVQMGSLEEARTAGRVLDEVVRHPGPSLLEVLESYTTRIRTGDLRVAPQSQATARKLASEVGAIAGRVIDVYL